MRVDGEIGWELMVSWTRSIPLKLVQSGQNVHVFWSTGNEIHLVFVRKKRKRKAQGYLQEIQFDQPELCN